MTITVSTTFAVKAISFFQSIDFHGELPSGVAVMNPYREVLVQKVLTTFFNKFYNDHQSRIFIWGINPGRFGAGVTGIPFTDPFALSAHLGISHTLKVKKEISSEFMYQVIGEWGGAEKFFNQFYINSLSPLGFTKHGRNFNFYDDNHFSKKITPFIVQSIQHQIGFCGKKDVAICLGTGKLFDFFTKLNNEHRFFQTILPIEHPRFVMQYRRKTLRAYLEKYVHTLSLALQDG